MTPQALQTVNAASFADLRRAIYAADQSHSATEPATQQWIQVGSSNVVAGVSLQCDDDGSSSSGNSGDQWWQRIEEECHALVFPVESVSVSTVCFVVS